MRNAEVSSVSANWSGYAVTSAGEARFSRVAASWVQPTGRCKRGQETYSVTWVGLGGFNRGSRALEQAGTAVDCGRSAQPMYSAWYELVPAAPVTLKLDVQPGDEIVSSVAVKDGRTIMQVRDVTRHRVRTVVRKVASPDLSSAEWIVEAPSSCFSEDSCTPLPLADFGTVPFSKASVVIGGHRYDRIDPPALQVTRLELRDYTPGWRGSRADLAAPSAVGLASALSAAGDAFNVSWQALSAGGSEPGSQPPVLKASTSSLHA